MCLLTLCQGKWSASGYYLFAALVQILVKDDCKVEIPVTVNSHQESSNCLTGNWDYMERQWVSNILKSKYIIGAEKRELKIGALCATRSVTVSSTYIALI